MKYSVKYLFLRWSNEGEQLVPLATGGRSDITLLYWDVEEHGVKVLKKDEITQISPLILDT